MRIDEKAAIFTRAAQSAYEKESRRAERPDSARASTAQKGESTSASKDNGFTFSFGKFGLRYEVEEPEVNAEEIAQHALRRFQRQQEAAFRAELEVEELRRTIASPAEETQDAAEAISGAALPEGTAPLHVRKAAQRAYQEAGELTETMNFRPGILIGQA